MANKSFYSEAKAVLELAGRIRFIVTESAIDSADETKVITWLFCQYHLIHDLNLPDPAKAATAYKRWLSSVHTLDLFSFGTFQKKLSAELRRYPQRFEEGERLDRSAFKQLITCPSHWGFMAPVYDVLDQFLIQPYVSTYFKVLLQWIDFSIKLNLESVDFESVMIPEYLEQEREMGDWVYPPDLIQELNGIAREWFSDFTYDGFVPKHGPHSVAEYDGRYIGTAAKYAAFRTDQRLEYFMKSIGWSSAELCPHSMSIPWDDTTQWRCSKIVLVPKSMVTNRTISKEPAVLQYCQQGIKACIDDYVKHHPFLSRVINFERQDLSAAMAREGSILGDFATTDLSAASDSVTLRLVKGVFRGTALLRGLICTRSDFTVVPGHGVLKLNKFAPMGSAVCFPVETLVFSLACECARRRTRSKTKFRVFGDDIVVPREYEAELHSILQQLHFTVNTVKSYGSTQLLNFREACGGEYFNGREVTPVRISRSFRITSFRDWSPSGARGAERYVKVTPVEYSCQVGFLNRLENRGLYATRRAAIWLFRGRKSFDRLWRHTVCDDQGGRYGIAVRPGFCDNYHLTWRRNSGYQCAEYLSERFPFDLDYIAQEYRQVSELKSIKVGLLISSRGMVIDDVAYHEWLLKSTQRQSCQQQDGFIEPLVISEKDLLPTQTSLKSERRWTLDPTR
jgi:hypothetical protein